MARVLVTFAGLLRTTAGGVFTARACGRERADHMWEGWVEFVPADGTQVLQSGRETTQPTLADLEDWATGLTPVYLEGALARAVEPLAPATAPASETPAYDRPASPTTSAEVADVDETAPAAILDPFLAYAKGADLLREQLDALSPRHLRAILHAYDLAPNNAALEVLTKAELMAMIISGVRARRAA